jgi:hypothetical protein
MANPNYANLLSQIGAAVGANNANLVSELEAQAYIFVEDLSEAEKQLFEYVALLEDRTLTLGEEYVAPQPGEAVDDLYPVVPEDPVPHPIKAYVGIYVSANGAFSGEYPEQSNTFIVGPDVSTEFEGLDVSRTSPVPVLSDMGVNAIEEIEEDPCRGCN